MHPSKMSQKESPEECVFFTKYLTIEQEYEHIRKPTTRRKDMPHLRTLGNYLLPKKQEYLNAHSISNFSRLCKLKSRNECTGFLLLGLLACEPFYNLVRVFKERMERTSEIRVFNQIAAFLCGVWPGEDESREIDVNGYIEDLKKSIDIRNKNEIEIFESVILSLHEDFLKNHFFEENDWEKPGDKKIPKIKLKYSEYSPVSEIFTGEIKKVKNTHHEIDLFTHLRIEKSGGGCVQKIMREYFFESSNTFMRDFKYNFNKLPYVLIIYCDGNNEIESELKVENEIYVLRSFICFDEGHNFYFVENGEAFGIENGTHRKTKNLNDYKGALKVIFYRKKKMSLV